MKNDNTKEKRMQTLPLLYYINKTPFYKLFSIKNLYQIAVCVLKMAGALGFEPRLPPSEGYNGFLTTPYFYGRVSVVVWTISSPYLTTQVRAVQSLHIYRFLNLIQLVIIFYCVH